MPEADEICLTEEQCAELRAAFQLFDKDKSGTITTDELQSVMQTLGHKPTHKEIEQMMTEVDHDNSGEIDFPEFMKLMGPRLREAANDEELVALMVDCFKALDTNGDGFIQADEIMQMMSHLGQPVTEVQAMEMLQEADLDGDGRIEYAELVALMSSPPTNEALQKMPTSTLGSLDEQ